MITQIGTSMYHVQYEQDKIKEKAFEKKSLERIVRNK